MALASISLDNFVDGQEVVLPLEVTGSASTPPPPPAATSITNMLWQIDTNTQNNLPFTENNAAPPPSNVTFGFDIAAVNCPNVDTWYILSVYCWDSAGDLTIKSVTFKRIPEPIVIEIDGGGIGITP